MIGKFTGLLAALFVTLAMSMVAPANACMSDTCSGGGTTTQPAQQQTWTAFGLYGTTDGTGLAGTNASGNLTPQSTFTAASAGQILTNLSGPDPIIVQETGAPQRPQGFVIDTAQGDYIATA